MINETGPMGRAAYVFTSEEFRKKLGLASVPAKAIVSWFTNRVTIPHIGWFSLHAFKDALGIKDDRGEVIEVNKSQGEFQVVMSDRERSR